MQSRLMSLVEVCTLTLAPGIAAGLSNYFVLPLIWDLHPSVSGSLSMAVYFAVLSIAIKYPIRRFFNAR